MEFGVLGPVEVRDGDRAIVLPPQRRQLLALLLCRPGAVVSTDLLIEGLWGSTPPRTAAKSLQIHLHHLRRALGDERRIVRRAPGYLLVAEPGEVDAARFEALVGQGRTAIADDRMEAARTLRRALGLWRGSPFAGTDHVSMVAGEALRLAEQRWTAEEELIGAELALGRHADVVARAAALVARHPLRERLRGHLMVALYRLGRQAEALEVHQEGRRLLADQLGLEPSAPLRRLEHAILVNDPALDPPPVPASARGRSPASGQGATARLPADIRDFTGRTQESASITRFLTGDPGAASGPGRSAALTGDPGAASGPGRSAALTDDPGAASGPGRPAAPAVATICGRPGVGKTTLAVHVAHRVCEVFPDGQLYVNLRGIEAEPADPSQVLARFIRAFGVEGQAIPGDLDERAELFRGLTATRRVLVVLDNAANERQVRPLLPGSPGCGVLVTSRVRLSALEGAQVTDLDGFEPEPALALLAKVTGPARVAAEPAAAERVVRLCGQLPLAVRIAAARLAARPTWHLATLAERLSDERRLLDELAIGDLEVRGSVALSYQLLDDGQRRLFRLLGHLPGLDFPGWVTMPLADTSRAAAERLIESLVEARLVEAVGEDGSGFARYRLHDLLRVFARERSAADDRPQDVHAALGRLYGAWLFLAERADDRLGFGQHLARIGRSEGPRWAPDTVTAQVIRDPLAWMERERALLVASVLHASELGLWHTAWDLAGCLTRFLQARWHVDDWRVTHETALEAARAAGDDRGEAAILRAIAEMHLDHDRYDEALVCLRTAAGIFARDGDELGRAHVRRAIAKAHRMLGRLEIAFACLRETLPVFEAHDDEPGLACALSALGGVHRESGRYDEALVAYRRARDVFRRLGDPHNEATVLCGMGNALHALGRVADAEHHFTESLAMCGDHRIWSCEMFAHASLGALLTDTGDLRSADRELTAALSISEEFGDRFGKALSLRNLGELRRRQGRLGEARSCLRQAHALFPPLELPAELP